MAAVRERCFCDASVVGTSKCYLSRLPLFTLVYLAWLREAECVNGSNVSIPAGVLAPYSRQSVSLYSIVSTSQQDIVSINPSTLKLKDSVLSTPVKGASSTITSSSISAASSRHLLTTTFVGETELVIVKSTPVKGIIKTPASQSNSESNSAKQIIYVNESSEFRVTVTSSPRFKPEATVSSFKPMQGTLAVVTSSSIKRSSKRSMSLRYTPRTEEMNSEVELPVSSSNKLQIPATALSHALQSTPLLKLVSSSVVTTPSFKAMYYSSPNTVVIPDINRMRTTSTTAYLSSSVGGIISDITPIPKERRVLPTWAVIVVSVGAFMFVCVLVIAAFKLIQWNKDHGDYRLWGPDLELTPITSSYSNHCKRKPLEVSEPEDVYQVPIRHPGEKVRIYAQGKRVTKEELELILSQRDRCDEQDGAAVSETEIDLQSEDNNGEQFFFTPGDPEPTALYSSSEEVALHTENDDGMPACDNEQNSTHQTKELKQHGSNKNIDKQVVSSRSFSSLSGTYNCMEPLTNLLKDLSPTHTVRSFDLNAVSPAFQRSRTLPLKRKAFDNDVPSDGSVTLKTYKKGLSETYSEMARKIISNSQENLAGVDFRSNTDKRHWTLPRFKFRRAESSPKICRQVTEETSETEESSRQYSLIKRRRGNSLPKYLKKKLSGSSSKLGRPRSGSTESDTSAKSMPRSSSFDRNLAATASLSSLHSSRKDSIHSTDGDLVSEEESTSPTLSQNRPLPPPPLGSEGAITKLNTFCPVQARPLPPVPPPNPSECKDPVRQRSQSTSAILGSPSIRRPPPPLILEKNFADSLKPPSTPDAGYLRILPPSPVTGDPETKGDGSTSDSDKPRHIEPKSDDKGLSSSADALDVGSSQIRPCSSAYPYSTVFLYPGNALKQVEKSSQDTTPSTPEMGYLRIIPPSPNGNASSGYSSERNSFASNLSGTESQAEKNSCVSHPSGTQRESLYAHIPESLLDRSSIFFEKNPIYDMTEKTECKRSDRESLYAKIPEEISTTGDGLGRRRASRPACPSTGSDHIYLDIKDGMDKDNSDIRSRDSVISIQEPGYERVQFRSARKVLTIPELSVCPDQSERSHGGNLSNSSCEDTTEKFHNVTPEHRLGNGSIPHRYENLQETSGTGGIHNEPLYSNFPVNVPKDITRQNVPLIEEQVKSDIDSNYVNSNSSTRMYSNMNMSSENNCSPARQSDGVNLTNGVPSDRTYYNIINDEPITVDDKKSDVAETMKSRLRQSSRNNSTSVNGSGCMNEPYSSGPNSHTYVNDDILCTVDNHLDDQESPLLESNKDDGRNQPRKSSSFDSVNCENNNNSSKSSIFPKTPSCNSQDEASISSITTAADSPLLSNGLTDFDEEGKLSR